MTLTHYELAEHFPEYDPQMWKEFLFDTEIWNWIQSELNVVQSAELNKVLQNISDTNSVGKAQIIGALSRLTENKSNRNQTGPTFVYSYVPLNSEQAQAENIQKLDNDPFDKN